MKIKKPELQVLDLKKWCSACKLPVTTPSEKLDGIHKTCENELKKYNFPMGIPKTWEIAKLFQEMCKIQYRSYFKIKEGFRMGKYFNISNLQSKETTVFPYLKSLSKPMRTNIEKIGVHVFIDRYNLDELFNNYEARRLEIKNPHYYKIIKTFRLYLMFEKNLTSMDYTFHRSYTYSLSTLREKEDYRKLVRVNLSHKGIFSQKMKLWSVFEGNTSNHFKKRYLFKKHFQDSWTVFDKDNLENFIRYQKLAREKKKEERMYAGKLIKRKILMDFIHLEKDEYFDPETNKIIKRIDET
jgi:hypothetical protein